MTTRIHYSVWQTKEGAESQRVDLLKMFQVLLSKGMEMEDRTYLTRVTVAMEETLLIREIDMLAVAFDCIEERLVDDARSDWKRDE